MNFEQAIEIILKFEGGYSNDSDDNGGETQHGISSAAFPSIDIKNLKKEEAIKLYRSAYWDRLKIDLMPDKLRLIVFDCAVNQGQYAAASILQRILGVKIDGAIGPDSIKAIYQKDISKLIQDFACARVDKYFLANDFQKYGKGWMRRLVSICTL
jgi:lysozyme family protein